MIGPMSLGEPHEIEIELSHVFELATGPDAASQAIEPQAGENLG